MRRIGMIEIDTVKPEEMSRDLSELTKAELIEFAESHGLEIEPADKRVKEKLLTAIEAQI